MTNETVLQLDGLVRRRITLAPTEPTPSLERLERRWLHRLMIWLHQAVSWPVWVISGVLSVLSIFIFGVWRLIPGTAGPFVAALVGLGLMGFSLADWAMLAWLPLSRRSFGPVAPQLVVMLGPRVAVSLVAAAIAWGWGAAPGLVAFGLGQVAGSVLYVWGLVIEPFELTLTSLTVDTEDWPADAPPLRMLHISDIHLERLGLREARLLNLVAQTVPDLIILTGDYLNLSYNRDPESMRHMGDLLARLRAPLGVYAVLGSPPADARDVAPSHFEDGHIYLLRRDLLELDLRYGRRLALLGLDCTHDVAYDGALLRNLDSLAEPGIPKVLLYHSPELMPVARQLDLRLYLCGHTHGGQVRLPLYGALTTSSVTGKRYEMGRYDENGTTQYVSRGVGLEGLGVPRMRLLCPPEITLVTLRGTEKQ
jgi:uncharacterized protein